jgi:hypothetical protein
LASVDTDQRLRLDYDQTRDQLRALNDIRFKLLAFVPTISGAAVGLLGRPQPAAARLAVGLLGLIATLGVLLYELGNTQAYEHATHRADELEKELGLAPTFHPPAGREHGLALVYGAALAGWTYLVVWGALRLLDVAAAQKVGAAVAVLAGLLVMLQLLRAGD